MRTFAIAMSMLLTAAPLAAGQSMYVVDYVRTQTLGDAVQSREEGRRTFAPTGQRRLDLVAADGGRVTEIIAPTGPEEGLQIVIDHDEGVVRVGELNFPASPVPAEALRRSRQARRVAARPPGPGAATGTTMVSRNGEAAPLRYVGEEARGPLTLRHERAEMPSGATLEFWTYFFPDSAVAINNRLTLATVYQGAVPDGTPTADETRITSVREVPFDPDAFSFDESRYRVEDLWEALGR